MRPFTRGIVATAVLATFLWLLATAPHILAAILLLIVVVVFLRAAFRIESSLVSEAGSPAVSGTREFPS